MWSSPNTTPPHFEAKLGRAILERMWATFGEVRRGCTSPFGEVDLWLDTCQVGEVAPK